MLLIGNNILLAILKNAILLIEGSRVRNRCSVRYLVFLQTFDRFFFKQGCRFESYSKIAFFQRYTASMAPFFMHFLQLSGLCPVELDLRGLARVAQKLNRRQFSLIAKHKNFVLSNMLRENSKILILCIIVILRVPLIPIITLQNYKSIKFFCGGVMKFEHQ